MCHLSRGKGGNIVIIHKARPLCNLSVLKQRRFFVCAAPEHCLLTDPAALQSVMLLSNTKNSLKKSLLLLLTMTPDANLTQKIKKNGNDNLFLPFRIL